MFEAVAIKSLSDEMIEGIARKTVGLSGYELQCIISSIICAASMTDDGKIMSEHVEKAVQKFIDEIELVTKKFNVC